VVDILNSKERDKIPQPVLGLNQVLLGEFGKRTRNGTFPIAKRSSRWVIRNLLSGDQFIDYEGLLNFFISDLG
jgi:hypothetical protein